MGQDHFSGRLPAVNEAQTDGPVLTLSRARDLIRDQRTRCPELGKAAILLREGSYFIERAVAFDQRDSGRQEAPLVIQSYKNERVHLIGGQGVKDFQPVSDPETLRRLAEDAHSHILQADLEKQGFTELYPMTRRGYGVKIHPSHSEVFYNRKPMTPARWPNEGWTTIKSTPAGSKGGYFEVATNRIKRWDSQEQIWLHGYWGKDWADSYEAVKSIDLSKKIIHTQPPHGVYGYKSGQRFYALNLLVELDHPGEYYIDRDRKQLFFYPPGDLKEDQVFLSCGETAMSFNDTRYIQVRHLEFSYFRGDAILIRDSQHIQVAGCTLDNMGNRAVVVSGGANNAVLSCDISETSDGSIVLSGGNRQTLEPAGHLVENNHIQHFSRWCRTYRPAIRITGVGNKIRHNLIHDGPHTAIQLSGNDHLIELNEVHTVCTETGDVGAFYMGRDWTERGTLIRYNYFHHLYGPYTHGAMAVYLDDTASGTTIFGNIFYKASHAVFIGGGSDNTVENNIFVKCDPSVHIDARGVSWARNLVKKGGGWGIYQRLHAVPYNQDPYTKYKGLADIEKQNPAIPKNNIIVRNISVGGKWLNASGVELKNMVIRDNFIDRNPRFMSLAKGDFRLKQDSPVYKLGFKEIPTEKIGLYEDAYRKGTF